MADLMPSSSDTSVNPMSMMDNQETNATLDAYSSEAGASNQKSQKPEIGMEEIGQVAKLAVLL